MEGLKNNFAYWKIFFKSFQILQKSIFQYKKNVTLEVKMSHLWHNCDIFSAKKSHFEKYYNYKLDILVQNVTFFYIFQHTVFYWGHNFFLQIEKYFSNPNLNFSIQK